MKIEDDDDQEATEIPGMIIDEKHFFDLFCAALNGVCSNIEDIENLEDEAMYEYVRKAYLMAEEARVRLESN